MPPLPAPQRPPASPAAPPPAPPPAYETRTPEQHFEELVTELNIPRQLALAIKEQESGRRPFQTAGGGVLTSAQNARGWFQVLPETASAWKLDVSDPFQNIEAGLRYIKEGLDNNHNDPDIAARYYHGGPSRSQWGPETEKYGTAVGARLRALLAADGGAATPAPEARKARSGDIHVPTAEELQAETTPPADAKAKPPAPPWYTPSQLLQTGKELGAGAIKEAVGAAAALGSLPHKIPGYSDLIDALYGTPGLSKQAFQEVNRETQASTPTEQVGKTGMQIAETFIPGSAIANTSARVAAAVAPRLAPYVGQTAARLLPRAAIEAPGAAGIAAAQGGDPTTAAGIAAAIPAAGAVARLPFTGALTPAAQRAVDWGRAQGIPVDLMASTSNRFAKNLQKVVENTPLGAAVRAGAERRQARALTRVGERLADDVHKAPTTRLQAGRSTGLALDARVAQVGARAKRHYQVAEKIDADPAHTQRVPSGRFREIPSTTPGGPPTKQPILTKMQVPIDITALRRALRPLMRAARRQPADLQNKNPALPALRSLYKGGPYRALLDLEADLGAIKGFANASGGLRTKSQGLAAQGVKALQTAVDDAARKADPALLDALQKARKATALKHQVDKLRTLFSGSAKVRASRGDQAAKGYRLATTAGDVNIEAMQKIAKQVGPTEMRKLGRGYLEGLLSTATRDGGYKHAARLANDWEKLGDQTKALFYKPDHIAELDNFFRLGRQLAEHPNPSGTALTLSSGGSVAWVLANPIQGLGVNLGAGAVAALMNYPTGVRLLTQGLTLPGGTPAAAQWGRQLQAFLEAHPEAKDKQDEKAKPSASPRVGTPTPTPPGR